eukprot:2561058-Pleurochrysis_carterae.AAC.2
MYERGQKRAREARAGAEEKRWRRKGKGFERGERNEYDSASSSASENEKETAKKYKVERRKT